MKNILRKHTIVTIILSLVVCVFVFALLSLARFIEQRSARVLEIKERIATYEINKKSFSEEAQQVKSLQSRLETLRSFIVTPATLPSVLSRLEALSASQQLEFEITGVTTPIENEQTKLKIDFTVIGTFDQTTTFLETMLKQSFAASFARLEMVALQKTEALAAKDAKKATARTEPREQQFRVFGTLEILSF